jgi:REP element-mobilizing transposase RayT
MSTEDPKTALPQRKRNRLEGYDYSLSGAYFVTICTHNRACLFGEINEAQMLLNSFGKVAQDEWLRTGQIRSNVILEQFVIMPNHVHGVIMIDYPWMGIRRPEDARQSIERIVAGFKAACVRRINQLRAAGADSITRRPIWQKSFYDEIIRDERHLNNVRTYIADNPAQWEFDHENPDRLRQE